MMTDDQVKIIASELVASLPTGGNKGRVRPPSVFNGHKTRYETFRQGIITYTHKIDKDENKIITALSFFAEGIADQWGRSYYTNHLEEIKDGTLTFDHFLRDADNHFHDHQRVHKAEQQITEARCGNKETVPDFFIRFDDLRLMANMGDAHHDSFLITKLERSLPAKIIPMVQMSWSSKIANKLEDIDERRKAKKITEDEAEAEQKAARGISMTYDAFRRRAEEADRVMRLELYTGEELTSRGQYNTSASSSNRAPAPYWAHDTPMDVDINRLSYGERQEALRKGLCFLCKQQGHMASDPRHDKENEEYRRTQGQKRRQDSRGHNNSRPWRAPDLQRRPTNNKGPRTERMREIAQEDAEAIRKMTQYLELRSEELTRMTKDPNNEDSDFQRGQ